MSDEITSLEDLKEAVGMGDEAEATAPQTPKEPVRDEHGRSYATGKRKDAVARVWVMPGSGKVTVNGKEMTEYFARPVLQMVIGQPFTVAGVAGQFDVKATVKGGGLSGQAGAVKHGISKALQPFERDQTGITGASADEINLANIAHHFAFRDALSSDDFRS